MKNFAKEYGINYREALRHPDVKATYQKGGKFSLKKLGRMLKPAAPVAKEIAKGAMLGVGHKSKHNIHNEGGTLLKGIPKNLRSSFSVKVSPNMNWPWFGIPIISPAQASSKRFRS